MTPQFNGSFTVLVVDDDPSVAACYQRLLSRAGYRTRIACDPAALLAAGGAGDADLLLIDYKMPAMDGLTFLAELRRRECRARCILVSAFLNEDVRSQAANLGVDRILEKPVDGVALRGAIGELLPLGSPRRSFSASGLAGGTAG